MTDSSFGVSLDLGVGSALNKGQGSNLDQPSCVPGREASLTAGKST